MTTATCLVDTDILSAIMRDNPTVMEHARVYWTTHKRFTFSLITRYEILRGLYAKNATAQLEAFNQFCAVNRILPITDQSVVQAGSIYGKLHSRSELIGDADILIAASAIINDHTIVTNTTRHFDRIDGLRVENWLKS